MLTMVCDRCGKPVAFNESKDGKAGRERWRFQGRDLIVDLCPDCAQHVRHEWLRIVKDWANPLPVEVKS